MIKSATQKLSKKSKDINILNKAKNKNAIRFKTWQFNQCASGRRNKMRKRKNYVNKMQ